MSEGIAALAGKLAPPPWLRVALAALAVGLLALAATTGQPPRATGSWGMETTYQGEVQYGANDTFPLYVKTPAAYHGRGLTVDVGRGLVALRTAGSLEGPPFRATLLDAAGAVVLDARLDPANPMSAPAGPPTAFLDPGAYVLLVSPLAGGPPVNYTLVVASLTSFAAQPEGAVVPPWTLAGPGIALAALALVPGRGPGAAPGTRGSPTAAPWPGTPPGEPGRSLREGDPEPSEGHGGGSGAGGPGDRR